jgi:hypothetical protein
VTVGRKRASISHLIRVAKVPTAMDGSGAPTGGRAAVTSCSRVAKLCSHDVLPVAAAGPTDYMNRRRARRVDT